MLLKNVFNSLICRYVTVLSPYIIPGCHILLVDSVSDNTLGATYL